MKLNIGKCKSCILGKEIKINKWNYSKELLDIGDWKSGRNPILNM